MRARTLLITLSVALMAFAPAPLPRPDRVTPGQKRLAECRRRLGELGVSWRLGLGHEGRPLLRFSMRHPDGGGIRGNVGADGDLADVLRNLVEMVEDYLRKRDRSPPP